MAILCSKAFIGPCKVIDFLGEGFFQENRSGLPPPPYQNHIGSGRSQEGKSLAWDMDMRYENKRYIY